MLGLSLFTSLGLATTAALDPDTNLHGCLASAGDLDDDGVPDLWVAGRPDDAFWRSRGEEGGDLMGTVWALSGKDGSVLFHIASREKGDVLGRSMASIGDVDQDGIPDLVLGAGGRTRGMGRVEVRSGGDGRLIHRIESTQADELFGFHVHGGEDLDEDGVPDFLASTLESARAYSGKDGTFLFQVDERKRLRRRGGYAPCPGVALLPDLDGDGIPDLARGGRVHSGAERSELLLLFPDVEIWLVGHLGDVNGDGTSDLYFSNVNQSVAVHSGADGKLLYEIDYRGGYLHGEGMTVDAIGDLDGDGVSELAIGANEAPWLDDPPDGGFASVVSGKTGESLFHRWAPENDGFDVSAIGDVDGDGRADLAIARRIGQVVEVLSSKDWSTIWTRAVPELAASRDR